MTFIVIIIVVGYFLLTKKEKNTEIRAIIKKNNVIAGVAGFQSKR